jgi:hypothetical protein
MWAKTARSPWKLTLEYSARGKMFMTIKLKTIGFTFVERTASAPTGVGGAVDT